jgi:plastocyanin
MKQSIICVLASTAFILTLTPIAYAKEYTIKMMPHADKETYAFEPAKLTIKSGDKITWLNVQGDTHNVMSESVPKGAKTFASPMLEKKGEKWSYTFTQAGTYRYHCHPHAELGMRGEIIVDHSSKQEETQENGHSHDHGSHDHHMPMNMMEKK